MARRPTRAAPELDSTGMPVREGGPRRLAAGRLEATLDEPDLTHVRFGGVEIVRRLLITVRDTNWETLEADVLSSSVSQGADGFEVELEGQHVAGAIDFRWRAHLSGDGTGRVTYELDGFAASDFRYCRIGLCVLHPVETCAGAAYRGSSAGTIHSGVLADDITPQVVADGVPIPLFPACDALELAPAGGGRISFAFGGDLFEMEDQRNWTDDSFKTYCTPAALGTPHVATKGKRFRQSVEVRAAGLRIEARDPAEPVVVSIGAPSSGRVPVLGLAMGADLDVPTDAEASALRALGLAHVRADVKVQADSTDAGLVRAAETGARVDAPIELALHLEPADAPLLGRVERVLRAADTPVARILAFHREARSESPSETSSAALVQLVRRQLGHLAPVGGGTSMDFAELNRTRPDAAATETVAWAINAQVHAFDDVSVMETLRGQAATVATARSFCGESTFAIGPITLRPRFNPAATSAPLPRDPDALPPHVDPRQAAQFCASWLAGSVTALALAGADSLTYFELVGMAGVMALEPSTLHPRFPSTAGSLFPVYHVLRALTPLRGSRLLECTVTPDGNVGALATVERIVLANLSQDSRRVLLKGLPWPAARIAPGEPHPSGRERLGSGESTIDLNPYAVTLLEPWASTSEPARKSCNDAEKPDRRMPEEGLEPPTRG